MSADAYENSITVGAMSYVNCLYHPLYHHPYNICPSAQAFIKVLHMNPQVSYQDLLHGVRCIHCLLTTWSCILLILLCREILKKKYKQKPQLSSSHCIVRILVFLFTIRLMHFTGHEYVLCHVIETDHLNIMTISIISQGTMMWGISSLPVSSVHGGGHEQQAEGHSTCIQF